jgi:hydrogenase nickel incorporation protein HypA/HybF
MHEATIAQQLDKMISAEAAKYGKRPVGAKISCGTFSAVNDELLREAMAAITKGTASEGLKLEVEHKPIEGLCRRCKKKFEPDLKKMRCTGCGSEDFDLLSDASFILEEIEFELE